MTDCLFRLPRAGILTSLCKECGVDTSDRDKLFKGYHAIKLKQDVAFLPEYVGFQNIFRHM